MPHEKFPRRTLNQFSILGGPELVGDPFACNGINPLPAMGSLLAARGSARAPQVGPTHVQ
eukprot:COSAG01_NODE_1576_length_9855_cov_32.477962_18_plen_60_part_00